MTANDAVSVLTISDDLPVAVARPVHSGKVRSVYFLDEAVSRRLVEARGYAVAEHGRLALMVISDRLSAFDCLWRGQTLPGVPGKGAALNAIAVHWFNGLAAAGIGRHHFLEAPHPLLWVVRQAQPVRIEAIARRYLTGSLWRAYARGERRIGGIDLPEGLQQYDRLPELLFTPSTKGVIEHVAGVEATDDAPLDPAILRRNPRAFALQTEEDVATCEGALKRGFEYIEDALASTGRILVDTKFEFGYAPGEDGEQELLYMDEVGTPDSSRIWARADWEKGEPIEHSKEQFREALLSWADDSQVLLNPDRMSDRSALAAQSRVPDQFLIDLGRTYQNEAEAILGTALEIPDRPRESLLDCLASFGLLT